MKVASDVAAYQNSRPKNTFNSLVNVVEYRISATGSFSSYPELHDHSEHIHLRAHIQLKLLFNSIVTIFLDIGLG